MNSFRYAFNGLKILLKNEHNARIHLFIGIAIVLLGIFLKVSSIEWMIFVFLIGIVFMAEIFNTIIEYLIDYISPTYRNQIKKIKDLGAAAVFVIAISAIILGLIIFLPKIWALF
ncbi:MAG: diacylglycerol kinase family protein [Candidatus Azobacteroides sp.]|nr:diacylglycerol kinase family protein [Candidatus Azobacteroides sp.]